MSGTAALLTQDTYETVARHRLGSERSPLLKKIHLSMATAQDHAEMGNGLNSTKNFFTD